MKSSIKIIASFCIVIITAQCSRVGQQDSSITQTRVVRGNSNQPSIKVTGKAKNAIEADSRLFEEQGFQCAYDRFLQMDAFRRSVQGSLAEVFGQSARDKDDQPFAVGFPLATENSEAKLKKFHPEVYLSLEAYARGVNRFIENMARLRPDVQKIYQQITWDQNYKPTPWAVKDSLSIATFLAFYLSSSLQEKFALGILNVIWTLGKNDAEQPFYELVDLRPFKDTFILDKLFEPTLFKPEKAAIHKVSDNEPPSRFPWPQPKSNPYCDGKGLPILCTKPIFVGSNSWAISQSYSGTGETLLANDPHLMLTLPSIMYEVALDSKSAGGSFRMRGVVPAGSPGILIGHNDDIGWDLTNLTGDVDDVYLNIIHKDGDKTRLDPIREDWAPIVSRTYERKVRIKTSDGRVVFQPVVKVIRQTQSDGVLVSDHLSQFREVADVVSKKEEPYGKFLKGGHSIGISYKWTGHDGSTEIAAIMGVNRSRNFDQFKAALQAYEVGAQNFLYADKKGNIGYYSHARFPVRKYLQDEDGEVRRPPYIHVEGFRRDMKWEKEYRKQMPELYNPSKGYIVTANNDPFGHSRFKNFANFEDYFGTFFDIGNRATRIEEMIQAKHKTGRITADDVKEIQTDVKDLTLVDFVELLKKADIKSKLNDDQARILDEVYRWDGQAKASSKEVSFVFHWVIELVRKHFEFRESDSAKLASLIPALKDETKEGLKEMARYWYEAADKIYFTTVGIKATYNGLKYRLESKNEDVRKRAVANIEVAFKKAHEMLSRHQVSAMKWGTINMLQFRNVLEGIVERSFTYVTDRDGSFSSVNPSFPAFIYTDKGRISMDQSALGASFRIIFKLSEDKPIDADIIIPGGNWNTLTQTDSVINEIKLWRKGQYRSLIDFQN